MRVMTAWIDHGIPSAGLFAGPVAWLLNTQINYALVPWVCAHGIQLVPFVTFGTALIGLAGGLLSWRAWQTSGPGPAIDDPSSAQPHRLTAGIGVLAAILFTAVILLQGAAGLVFQGCER
jgi:hypothetical protein